MKSLKECLTPININESKFSFDMEIKREPLKLSINVESFYVDVYGGSGYELTNKSSYDDFSEQWENTTDNGDDFEFNADVDILVLDQDDNECILAYEATYEVGYPDDTDVEVKRNTSDEIGLSEENIEKIIREIHNHFLYGDYAADEVAEALYDYCS